MDGTLYIGASEPLGTETTELLDFAARELGYRRYNGQKPGTDARTLVWLDLLSTDDAPESRATTGDWQKEGGEALVVCSTAAQPRAKDEPGPLLNNRLLPREQLRSLAWRDSSPAQTLVAHNPSLADDRVEEFGNAPTQTLDAHYRECPSDYAADTGEDWSSFRERLLQGIRQAQRNHDKTAQANALFKAALTRLGTGGRWRDFEDLLVVLDETLPTDLDADGSKDAAIPTLEAAVCIRRARHRWWRHGADLRPKPVMLVRAAPESLAAMDWQARQAVLRGAALFVPAGAPVPTADESGLKAVSASVAIVHFPRWLRAHHWTQATPELGYRLANQAWSAALSQLLVRGRPLRHYGCTLLFPFDPGPAQGATFQRMLERAEADGQSPRPTTEDTEQLDQDARQARLYFLPHIRQLLFASGRRRHGSTLTPIHEWRLPADPRRPWRVTLRDAPDHREDDKSGHDEDVSAAVTSVRLLRYYNGIYLLALRLELPTAGGVLALLDASDAHWWQPLVFGSEDDYRLLRQRSLSRWLRFTNLVRVLYPTFVEQHREGKLPTLELRAGDDLLGRFQPQKAMTGDQTPLPEEARSLLSAIAHEPLQHFFGTDAKTRAKALALIKGAGTLHDARFFVSVAYAPAGPALPEPGAAQAPAPRAGGAPPSATKSSRQREPGARWDAAELFALALYVDRFEDLPGNDSEHAFYDPSWIARDLPERSLGLWDARGMRAGFTDSANVYLGNSPFFARTVAPRHVPLIYERMLAMALFYRATLRRFNEQISEATEALDRPRHEEQFRKLREHFIEFTNRYWFRELSGEMQGREIFALQQRGLDLDAAYKELKDEMERADEFLAARRAAWEQRLASRVGWVAFGLAILGVFLTYLPLLQGPDGQALPMIQAVFLDVPGATPWARLAYLLGPLATLALATMALMAFIWATLGGGLKRVVDAWRSPRKPRR